jgi:hypothetical protein
MSPRPLSLPAAWKLCTMLVVYSACLAPIAEAQATRKRTVTFESATPTTVVTATEELKISPVVYEEIKAALRYVTRGQKIEVSISNSEIVALKSKDQTFEIDGDLLQVLDTPDGGKILRLKAGGQFQVAPDKIDQSNQALYFMEIGYRLRLTILGYKIVCIDRHSHKLAPVRVILKDEIRKALSGARAGDRVEINGLIGELVTQDRQSMTLAPLATKTKVQGSSKWLAKSLIKSFSNLTEAANEKAAASGDDEVEVQDALSEEDLREGDTVGVGLLKGVITSLSPTEFGVRLWEDGQFTEIQSFNRREYADRIRRTELSSIRRLTTPSGDVTVISFRKRIVYKGRLELRANISHDLDGKILAGATLQAHRDGDPEQPTVGAAHKLPSVFSRELYEYRQETEDPDPNLELVLSAKLTGTGGDLVSIKAQRAVNFIAQRLSRLDGGNALVRGYRAVVENGDPRLVRVLISHYLKPTNPSSVREEALLALRECEKRVAEITIKDLNQKDALLKGYGIVEGDQLIEQPLPIKPARYRIKLLDLLMGMESAIDKNLAKTLFELYLRYDETDVGNKIIDVLRNHAKAAVAAVVEVAGSTAKGASDAEFERSATAARLLRYLGEPALAPLCKELLLLGNETKARAIKRNENKLKPEILITQALNEIIASQRKNDRLEQNRRVIEVRGLIQKARKPSGSLRQQNWSKALDKINQIPKDNENAAELRPQIYLELAKCELTQKQRGSAAELLRQGRKFALHKSCPAQIKNQLDNTYGEILLSALTEELEFCVLRRGPGDGYRALKTCNVGERFNLVKRKTKNLTPQWVEVVYKRDRAFIRKSLVKITNKTAVITKARRGVKEIRKLLKKSRDLSTTTANASRSVSAELLAREVRQLHEQERFTEALTKLYVLRTYNDAHPVFDLMIEIWFKVNWIYPALAGALLLVALAFGVRGLFNRQRKVTLSGDLVYYGRDRARRERELE